MREPSKQAIEAAKKIVEKAEKRGLVVPMFLGVEVKEIIQETVVAPLQQRITEMKKENQRLRMLTGKLVEGE